MNREVNKNNRPTPPKPLLKSFYQPPPPLLSPDHKSINKNSSKGSYKKIHHGSMPKVQPIDHKPTLNYKSNSPRTVRSSITPRAFQLPKEHEIPRFSPERDNKSLNDRYHLKQTQEKQKKNNVSPKSIESTSRTPRPSCQQTIKVNDKKQIVQEKREGNTFNVKTLLTADQYSKFGQRFPQKFKRVGLLGRGGFSLVWLGYHRSSKRRIAIKQILSKNPHETHMKQIWFCSYFFQKGGQAREEFKQAIGINNICRMYTFEIEKQDTWLYYELCQESLGSALFDLKGQTVNGQRIFRVQYGQLLYRMRTNQQELLRLVTEVAKALTLINSHNIVHSDLKTQNIMLITRKGQTLAPNDAYIRSLKLIDFGSSFLFTNLRQFSMATPEYMPPQILNYILFQNQMEHDAVMLKKMATYKHPWTIDIWSLGCIVLEIVSGVPLWMSVKTRTPDKQISAGLFAVKNRVFTKIIQKQIQIVQNLDHHLKYNNHSGIVLCQPLKKVLRGMLCLEPTRRISPWDLLSQLGVHCPSPVIPSF